MSSVDVGLSESLVQTTEAARILGVASETVRAMERRGELPAIKTGRGVRLFERAVVERIAERRAAALGVRQLTGAA